MFLVSMTADPKVYVISFLSDPYQLARKSTTLWFTFLTISVVNLEKVLFYCLYDVILAA